MRTWRPVSSSHGNETVSEGIVRRLSDPGCRPRPHPALRVMRAHLDFGLTAGRFCVAGLVDAGGAARRASSMPHARLHTVRVASGACADRQLMDAAVRS